MNKIEFVKDKIPFTQVANDVLRDKRLSAKAKGLYAYLYSKPDGWDFAIDRIALEMADGRVSINQGLKELEVLGFLTRKKQADGRVVYIVHFPPIEPNAENQHLGTEPNAEKAMLAKSHVGKIGTISNKDLIVIKKDNNKEIDLPNWLNKEAWESWVSYKKEKKQKLTPRTIEMQLKKLSENRESHVAMIEQSISNGWTGLFPLKTSNYSNHKKIYVAQ